MSNDLLVPIWTRLDSVQPVFFHADLERTLKSVHERLGEMKVLAETTPSLHGLCLECDGGNLVRAMWVPNSHTGKDEPRLPCPNCGPVPISADSLRRWVVDVPVLLAGVSTAARIRPALATLVENHLWYLGSATWLGRSRQVYFTRAAHARVRDSIVAAVKPRPRAVLFHPTEHSVRLWNGATPNPVVALESVVSLEADGLTFDTAVVEGILADAGLGNPKPKPPRKRSERAEKIQRLERELREWLPRARSHAFATRDLTGTPQLLKQLTQQDLAIMAKMEEYDVSRCLNDPDAQLLRRLWEAAIDLDCILSWDGHVVGDPP